MNVTWTGQRHSGGLLYTAYNDLAVVRDDAGSFVGEVLKTPEGRFDTRSKGVTLGEYDDEATAVEALRVLHESGRDFNAFAAWKASR